MKRIVALVAAAFLSGCSATQPAASPARVVADLPPAVSVAWAPDGQSLLYAPFGQDGFGPAMRLSLDHPDQPETVTTAPTHSLAVSPDGRSLAYVCAHQGAQRRESSICVQPLPMGEPVDLFAGTSAIHGVSGALFMDRWVDGSTLAYQEGMGTAARQLWLLDVPGKKLLLPESIDYAATIFTWAPDNNRVAGQWAGGPHHFRIWDRTTGEFIKPRQPLPGAQQEFEAWAPDGRALLFTAWDGGFPYWDLTATATLYRWNLTDGRVEKVAGNAGRAVWSGSRIAYVRLGEAPELIVTGPGGWTQPLGKLTQTPDGPPQWPHQPLVQGDYVAFANANGEWYVSPLAVEAPRLLTQGRDLNLLWAPDARHIAVRSGERLTIFARP